MTALVIGELKIPTFASPVMNRVFSPEETLFADALALSAAERAACLAKACGDKVDRLAQLVTLLAARRARSLSIERVREILRKHISAHAR